jgi:phage repressor protein C with HTH and peptisase S24 domain
LKINYNTVKTWGNRKRIPIDILLEKLQNETIDLNWLLKDKTNIKQIQEKLNKKDTLNTNLIENKIDIPYYPETYAAAGAGAYNYEKAPKVISFTKTFLEELLELTKFTGLHIITASGDKLFILPFEIENHQIREGGIYIISCSNGVLVKRIYLNPFEGKITLKSDNPEIPDIVITGDELNGCQIIGRVVGSIKKF